MQAELGTQILKMLVILLLGGRLPVEPAPGGVDVRAFRPPGAPVSGELDVTRLRELVAESQGLTELIYVDKVRSEARKEAAALVGLAIGAKPALVREAFAGIRGVTVWLTAFGDRPGKFRFLAVIDTGGARGILGELLEGAGRFPGYHTTVYAGTTLHGFAMGGGYGVWCAEAKGLIAVGLDPIAVQRFLLSAADTDPEPEPAQAKERSLLEVDIDTRAFFDMLMSAMGRRERDEFLIASALMDFPSWLGAGATYDGRRIEAQVALNPRSSLARALRQPATPRLMGAIPEDCGVALVVGFEDARVGWEFVRSAVAFATQLHRPGADVDLAEEFRRETGFDAVEALFGNLRAGALIVPKFERAMDLERRSLFVFEVADAGVAEIAIKMMVAAMWKDGVDVREERGAMIWRAREKRDIIAIKGTTVVVAPGRESSLEVVLDQLGRGESKLARALREAHPSATAFATVDFAGLGVGGGLDELDVLATLARQSVGVSFENNVLRATAELGVPEVSKIVLGVVRAERARAAHRGCTSGLRRVYIAAYRYAAANGGFPETIDEMRKFLRGSTGMCATSRREFVYRSELAGKRVRDFPDRGKVVIAHDPLDGHPDGGAVVYLSGRAEWLQLERFEEFVAELDRKAAEEPKDPQRPEPEPEPVF